MGSTAIRFRFICNLSVLLNFTEKTHCFSTNSFSPFDRLVTTEPVNPFIYVRVSHHATLKWSWFLPGSSLSFLALKQQRTIIFLYGWLLNCGNYTDLQVEPLPYAALSGGFTNLSPLFNNWNDAELPLPPTRSTLGHLSTCRNCYVVVKRYWAFRRATARATARATEPLSHAASRQKKTVKEKKIQSSEANRALPKQLKHCS